jgi:hypothetical protein
LAGRGLSGAISVLPANAPTAALLLTPDEGAAVRARRFAGWLEVQG